ncbi:hypothetical protein DL764_008035 [Monosporascus ibericus]|uniref:Deacetylase sirtuin-type domain-containing protein n=1 Tax=Monosporascus ibericus TaxID=155417 RepID=A0A4Q4SYI1_9PEZI|nr:hypothetical protein DL764_008035 [Monosporascus ibericus]
MGQQSSRELIDDDTPPQTLEDRSLAAVAKHIKDGRVRRIVVLTGAGISTAAGIPDFRSPGTGLYNNLARLNLPHPEAVFDIDFFVENPQPFYVLAKELYPGNFSPTISHVFISLLAKKNLLRKLFTQNIDCLERVAGVPDELIVEAHGSFATQRCVQCKTPFPDKEMREHVARGEPPHCAQEGCGGLVKPDIVFFGEQLPAAFFENRSVPATADLMLVLGTSLTVHPFAGLPLVAMEDVPRVLFNLQRVGDFGTRADDVLYLGDCDSGIRKLADELGWREELESLWESVVGEKEARRQRSSAQTPLARSRDEVEEITEEMEDKLKLGSSGPDRQAQDTDADQRGQDEEEVIINKKDNDGNGGEANAPGAPTLPAAGAAPGRGEDGAPPGGGGGLARGHEAEDPGAKSARQTDAVSPTHNPGRRNERAGPGVAARAGPANVPATENSNNNTIPPAPRSVEVSASPRPANAMESDIAQAQWKVAADTESKTLAGQTPTPAAPDDAVETDAADKDAAQPAETLASGLYSS